MNLHVPLKIRLLSDLHLELHEISDLNFKKKADVVILAGDIGDPFDDNYIMLLEKLSLLHEKVFVITGNHEYYSKYTMSEIDTKIKQILEDESDIHFLQMNSVSYKGVKFMGCTLWSHANDKTLCKYMNDFNYITFDEYVTKHNEHREWLEQELTLDFPGKICVITHHLPSFSLINEEYHEHPLNIFFATDINTKCADVWCYGHTHKANQTEINNVKFYCNPRGHPDEKSGWNIDCIFEL